MTATVDIDLGSHKLGWHDTEDDYVFKPKKGLNAEIIREMSAMKRDPSGCSCPSTVLGDADRPTSLRKNRYSANDSGVFVDADDVSIGYTVDDTGGCSAAQIIAVAGLGQGHLRFGLTRSALEDWIASIT